MKKYLPLLIACLCLVSSCGHRYSGSHGEKTQKDAEKEFVKSLSDQEQKAVVDKAELCMNLLRDGNIDEAVSMIYVLYQNVVYQKSDSYTEELKSRFTNSPIVEFSRDYVAFSTQGNNDIQYSMTLGGLMEGLKMKLMFNPVLVDGEWYLTFKDGSQSSKALPLDRQVHELAPAPEEITLNK